MKLITQIWNKVKSFFVWFKQASLIKKIGVVLVLLLAIFFLTAPLRSKAVAYQTAPVTRETIQETVSESGNIASNGQTQVASTATGIIEEMDTNNGDVVKAGDTLFKVKATATPQEQANAYTTYENAVSALQTAQNTTQSLDAMMWTKQQAYLTAQDNQNYKNNNTVNPATKNNYTDLEKEQIDSAVVQTQKDFEAAQQAYKTNTVAIAAAQASVNSTKLAYQITQNLTVTAPIDGTVENVAYSVGDKVTAGATTGSIATTTTASTQSSSPVLYISTSGSEKNASVVVQVNEVDFSKIKEGQSAQITLPALQNKKFTGHVTKIDHLGTNTSSVISFAVYISLDKQDSEIAPNMTVDVDISTSKHDDTLTVPNSAIKPYKGGKAVQVFDKTKSGANQVKYVPVTVGIKSIDKTEILSGVTEGTIVVTGTNTAVKSSTGGGGALGN